MQRTRSRIQRLHSDYQKTETKVTGYVADMLRGSRDVKLYAMEDRAAEDFDNRVWEVGQKSYQRDVQSHIQWMKHEATGYVLLCNLQCAGRWYGDIFTTSRTSRQTIG